MGRSVAVGVGSSLLVTWVVSVVLTGAWVAMGTGWGTETDLLVGKAVVAAVAGLLGAGTGARLVRRRLAGPRARLAAAAGAGTYLLLDAFASALAGSVVLAAVVLVAGAAGTAAGALLGSRRGAAANATHAHGR